MCDYLHISGLSGSVDSTYVMIIAKNEQVLKDSRRTVSDDNCY